MYLSLTGDSMYLSFRGDNSVRGKLDGPLLQMLNELRKEVSGLCDFCNVLKNYCNETKHVTSLFTLLRAELM